ncbi:MAG: AAA family ATPase [Methylomarinum sp.]|nr:AAA family ATPase [Methylomarinum sp.]
MITKINVDGFKSLSDFNLKFNRGLNVLIGPNGVGKSNICQSLALIGAAANNELTEYILSLGGVKNIFKIQKNGSNELSRSFSINCNGLLVDTLKKENDINLVYEYGLTVSVGEKLCITKEHLKITRLLEKRKRKVIINIKRNLEGIATANILNDEFAGPINSFYEDDKEGKKKPFKLDMKQNPADSFLEIFNSFYFFVHIVAEDLKKLKVLNIEPHIAKKPSDILEPLKMLSDGKRLSNAIYNLCKRNDPSLKELNTFMENIMPRYKEIHSDISSDGLTRSFSISDIDGNQFPAQSLSDGTVKTIAFMVGMLECNIGSVVIEEPENYLHPWACHSLVQYIRDSFTERSCILTTHSETMLNSINPSEIIVCTNADGTTKAERLSNVKELEKAIEQSGFGSGYHYISGSLGGVPL